jgi:PelA/Pel-15E family pectate lyase
MRRIALLMFLVWSDVLGVFGAQKATDFLSKGDEWFRGEEGRIITRNILSWQARSGSWPKNTETTKPFSGDAEKIAGTFDNGATTGELRFLARAFNATGDAKLKEAFLKGLQNIFDAQYPNGGWPQYFPLSAQYHRHITFNDDSMTRLMQFLRDVAREREFEFVGAEKRKAAMEAFDRGVGCILKAQVKVGDTLTVWCAQHDEVTLQPATARTYELPSLSGSESAGILELLMSIEKPSAEVIRAVDAGVAWFEAAKLKGVRQTRVDGDKRIVSDLDAPALWARFYEIGTNRPFFSGRDGVKKYSIAEIESERRNGYAWYGEWGRDLPAHHAAWIKRIAAASESR